MIIKGGARSSGGFFAYHLMKTEENERVEVKEMRGLLADTVPEAFTEMRMVAAGTRGGNYFYHASINPREDEHLTPEQWDIAVDRLEQNLGLTDHARFQVEHEKNGRTHRHIVWSRVDLDTMTLASDSFTYLAHDKTRLELEREFSHELTTPTPQPSLRKSREFADWENFRAAESGIDPKAMKAEITELWQQSDGGRAFQAAIEEKGYLLAKGDRRDFILIDPTGDIHSLARRVDGARAADIRAKMGDLDRDSLMGAKEASAWMKGKDEAENSGSSAARVLPQEQAQLDEERQTASLPTLHHPKLTVLEKYALAHPPEPREYVQVSSAQDVSDFYKALYTSPQYDPALSDTSKRRAWESEQTRLTEIDRTHAEASHDPPAGEAPVEPVSFERATRGIDPPQTFPEREPLKRDNETWLEFVTRAKPPEQSKDKSEEREPEVER